MEDSIYEEIMTKTRNKQLSSVETEKLYQYIDYLVNFEGSIVSRYTERSAQLLTINSLLTNRTLEKVNSATKQINETSDKTNTIIRELEGTIKKLNSKNTILTVFVIFLSLLMLAATCTQVYFMRKQPLKEIVQTTKTQNLQKSTSEAKALSPKTPQSISEPEGPTNKSSHGVMTEQKGNVEKELNNPQEPPKNN